MMRKMVLALAACTVVAACGGAEEEAGSALGETGDAGEAISSEEVIERAREGTVRPQPGYYRSEVELVDLDIPGAPPEAAEMMRGQMAQTNEFCLTEEDVEEGYRRMASQPQGENCSFTRFDVDGGEIDAVMTCSDPGGGSVDITMQGTGGETSSQFTMRMAGNFGGSGEGSMTMTQSSKRIGECPSD